MKEQARNLRIEVRIAVQGTRRVGVQSVTWTPGPSGPAIEVVTRELPMTEDMAARAAQAWLRDRFQTWSAGGRNP